MALSPLDIHNKEFASKFRGYDEDEVNEFLEQIMKDYENVLEENKTLKSSLKQSKEQVSHFNSIEANVTKIDSNCTGSCGRCSSKFYERIETDCQRSRKKCGSYCQ